MWIQAITTISVLLVAVIAAVVSYRHMHTLVLAHGEDAWAAALIPLSVDGTIIAASMSLLSASRHSRRGEILPWTLLVISALASLGANVAVAEPTPIGRLIAAWPSFALIGAYEMLMNQIRHTAHRPTASLAAAAPDDTGDQQPTPSPDGAAHSTGAGGPASKDGSGGAAGEPDDEGRALWHAAWHWALEHRGHDGALPSGGQIAHAFSRSPRWGRLVKNAGLAGRLTVPPTGDQFNQRQRYDGSPDTDR